MGTIKFFTGTQEEYDNMKNNRYEELKAKYCTSIYDPDFENNSRSVVWLADKHPEIYNNLYMFLKATEDEVIYFDKAYNVRKFIICTEEDVLVEAF